MNPDLAGNPVADWDVVYLPYCDGSLFAGDVDRMLRGSLLSGAGAPSMGYQRGLQNLTAALDIAVTEFPSPSRILLTGVSGGAFGTLLRETSEGGDPGVELGSLDTEIDGVTVLDWLTAMIEGTAAWDDLVDPSVQ